MAEQGPRAAPDTGWAADRVEDGTVKGPGLPDACPWPSPGQLVGQYRVVAFVGEGGFGRVYRARDELLDRPVALKFVKRDAPEDARVRFTRESRLHAGLRHPSFARLLAAGLDPRHGAWIAQEFVEGTTVEALVRRDGPLSWRQAIDLACRVLDGLHEAHRMGIVHRDIKPANLMVLPDGSDIRILDLGLARETDVGCTAITAPRVALGSPRYMAPEQVRGGRPGPAMDLYAMAGVLFFMLTGRSPYAGDTPIGAMLEHLQTPVPQLPGHVPARLAEQVRAGLSKRPEARPESARAMRDELLEASRLAEHLDEPSDPPPPDERGPSGSVPPAPVGVLRDATTPSDAMWTRFRRRAVQRARCMQSGFRAPRGNRSRRVPGRVILRICPPP